MAGQKRTLNIPIYDVQPTPAGAGFDGEILDAEVIENGPSVGERAKAGFTRGAQGAARANRTIRDNGVKDTLFMRPADAIRGAVGSNSPRIGARQQGRAQRDQQGRVREARQADAKQAQKDRAQLSRDAFSDPLAELKLNTVRAGERYMESLRKSGVLDEGQTKATQRKELSGMHQVYASMMVLQCVQPLQQGLSGANIMSVLGMGASMWALSPNFRTQLGTFTGQLSEVISDKITGKKKKAKKDAKAQSKYDTLAEQGRADQLGRKWQRRLDKIQHAERGHRLPFTAESAAMTEVALAESAYADMRRPGANPDLVQDRYVSAMSVLYEYVEADGLEREEVSRAMRVIVGKRLGADPSVANVFSELGHGRFVKSPPREVHLADGGTALAWTGDFLDSYEGRTISKGSFKLRPPMGVNEHRVLAAETLAAEMTSAKSVGEMNDVLSQFVVGSAVGRYPEVVDQLQDPKVRTRLGKARTMFASMAADGLTAEEQHFAYSAAYIDAVNVVQEMNPELGNKWAAQYGAEWPDKVAEAMHEYNAYGAQAQGFTPTPGPTPFPAEEASTKRSYTTTTRRFTATEDGSVHDADVPEYAEVVDESDAPVYADEDLDDLVDAEVIDDEIVEGEAMDDEDPHGDDIVDAEVVEDQLELGAADLDDVGTVSASDHARDSILDGLSSTSAEADYEEDVELNSTSAKVRRARENAAYNDAKTGGITGFGHDDANLRDAGLELG